MSFNTYIRINSDTRLRFSERVLSPTKDIFYSNNKMNLPSEILGLSEDKSLLYNDKRIYLIALLKRKIEDILDNNCKYDMYVMHGNDFDVFFYINENDKSKIRKWLYQEQLHNIITIH